MIVKNIPERAEFADEVQSVICDNCFEDYIFELKQGKHKFTMGLSDILRCLKFAEKQGAIPKIDSEWWIKVDSNYSL